MRAASDGGHLHEVRSQAGEPKIILAGRCYLQQLEQYGPFFRRRKQSLKSLYFPPRTPTQPTVFSAFLASAANASGKA
jgi:hypothetical protein